MSGGSVTKLPNEINFLEYPLWVLNCSNKSKLTIEVGEEGFYQILSGKKLPTSSDIMVLYFLLSRAFSSSTMSYSTEVTTSRYQIAKNVHGNRNNVIYQRIRESLHRWVSVSIHFDNLFYDGIRYKSGALHFIDSFHIEEDTGELKVRFNQEYISHLNASQHYRRVSFEELKKIRRPASLRLYEILLKNDSAPVIIETRKLAEKMTLAEIYPSQIIKKILPAVREINRSGLLYIECAVGTGQNGESILTFNCKKDEPPNAGETNPYMILVTPVNRVGSVKRIVKNFQGDPAVLISNILFANRKARKNYAGYLRKALNEDRAEETRTERLSLGKKLGGPISEVIPQIMKSIGIENALAAEYLALEAAEDLSHVINPGFISAEFLLSKVLSYGLK